MVGGEVAIELRGLWALRERAVRDAVEDSGSAGAIPGESTLREDMSDCKNSRRAARIFQ